MNINDVQKIVNRITVSIFNTHFLIKVSEDDVHGGRVYIQMYYQSPCTKTGKEEVWSGGKHYLSEYMTEDEVVKKCYVAFEQAVKHEILEGFKVDGIILFNPHVDYKALLEISNREVKRVEKA